MTNEHQQLVMIPCVGCRDAQCYEQKVCAKGCPLKAVSRVPVEAPVEKVGA